MDDVQATLGRIRSIVENARAMPMSASCVVHRDELLALVDEAVTQLPVALRDAHQVLGERAAVVEEGSQEAERLVADARHERARLLTESDVVSNARAEAERVLEEAYDQADAMRGEVEDYVDRKLANFEVVLQRTLEAVERGRQKLAGRSELDALASDDVFGADGPRD